MPTKKLIINADDYGLTLGCDTAINEAVRAGAITSSSCLVWSRDDIRMKLQRYSPWHGVHLRLTDGGPVLPRDQVRSLLEEDGHFPRSQQAVAMRMIDIEEVRAEWRAQIVAFQDAGGQVSHLDTHRHCHALLNLHQVYEDLCCEFGVAGVPLSWRQREMLRARRVRCADFTETRWTDGEWDTLRGLLADDFTKYGSVHLMTHPGHNDDELRRASGMTEVRQREFDLLMATRPLHVWLVDHGIEKISYSDLQVPDQPTGKIDILFLAWNRRKFTEASIAALEANTDWSRVARLFVYCDGIGPDDGTRQILAQFIMRFEKTEVHFEFADYPKQLFGGPVAVMNHYLSTQSPRPWFAKIDNDVVLPPGWLGSCLRVVEQNSHVDLLGIEPTTPIIIGNGPRAALPAGHIGGIGLMRTAAFEQGLPVADGRFGFSDWQIKNDVNKAWLNPSIPVILLDRLPMKPWSSLSADYERAGWQRPWQRYTADQRAIWDWWKGGK